MKDKPSTKRVTIDDVSRLAGVSNATVSRVINGSAFVAEETVARVRAAIEELNYIPNHSARVLAGGKTRMLGLIVPEIGARSLLPLLAGIEAAAREIDYGLLIYSTGHRKITSEELLKAMGPHNTDGMLIYVNSLDETGLRSLYSSDLPMVLLHQIPPKDMDIPYVSFQNKSAVQALVDHLIEVHGYRRIAFLRGPEGHDDSRQREKGYRASLKNHGIPFDASLIGYGGFNRIDAKATVERWIGKGGAGGQPDAGHRPLEFEAIFCGEDEAALGAIQAIQNAGLRVPEDIAVTGFDDIEFGYNISSPLTTVHADFKEAGLQAAMLLGKLICSEPTKKKVLLPAQLVIRRSCGCPL